MYIEIHYSSHIVPYDDIKSFLRWPQNLAMNLVSSAEKVHSQEKVVSLLYDLVNMKVLSIMKGTE